MLRRIFMASVGAMALAGTAFAADLPSRAPPPVFLAPPPIYSWTGFYAGLNAGYSWGASNSVHTSTINAFADPALKESEGPISALSQTGTAPVNTSGFIGGGQIGYNLQFSNSFVAGLEADLQGLGVRGEGSFANSLPDTAPDDISNAIVDSRKTVDWLGTVRGRLGFLATPAFLVYGTGGLAYGGVTAHTNVHSFWTDQFETIGPAGTGSLWSDAAGHFSGTRVGWTVGGGLEWLFAPNWSLKAEYLYYDLGSVQFGLSQNVSSFIFSAITGLGGGVNAINQSTSHTRFNGNVVRAGLNYHFNWGGAPVIAKY